MATAVASKPDAIHAAVEMFGPTVTISTSDAFKICGAADAMIWFLNELSCDTEAGGDTNDAGFLLDGADLGDLHEAYLQLDESRLLVASLLPADGEVTDRDYDRDPRVRAVEAATSEAETQARKGLSFEPRLQTAHSLTRLSRGLDTTLALAAGRAIATAGTSKDVVISQEELNKMHQELSDAVQAIAVLEKKVT